MKNLAIIPARSGSKGVADKNVKLLNGKPLLAYSIQAAKESYAFDTIMVSTDSEEYAKISREYGAEVPFLRSSDTSTDTAGSWDVVREVVERYEAEGRLFDRIMLLQPTSPMRTSDDIIKAFELMEEKKANAIESVTEMEHSPLWSNTLPDNLSLDKFEDNDTVNTPRQSLPVYYRINGAIYLINREELDKENMFKQKCFAYVMSREHSIDIDTEMDFMIAEVLFKIQSEDKE